jgi:predicted O-linked N-acetylglucosamine transferase (SPINDLY family)
MALLVELLGRTLRRLMRGRKEKSLAQGVAQARALLQAGEFERAAAALERALQSNPGDAAAWSAYADVRFELAQVDEAIVAYRAALERAPASLRVRSNLLFALAHREDDPLRLLEEHRRWAAAAAPERNASRGVFDNPRDPARRLRIGYVSGDFRGHAISMFIEPVLARHHAERIAVHCYDNAPSQDVVARRLRGYGGAWRDIRGLGTAALRELVRSDGIDILVDLAGHTAGHRLADFAQRLAPVQATWLGYHGTTGITAMDYRLTDRHADPPGESEGNYVEQLARLPHCLWCYRPPAHAAQPPQRASRRGAPVFASLNNLRKITPRMLDLWARILQRLPDSRLLVAGAGEGPARRGLLAQLVGQGVEPTRVECVDWLQPADFAAFHARVDIALDTYPFNGGATTIGALHAGVPVVSLAGRTAASRCGRTILRNVGLEELVAPDAEGYIEAACALASDRVRLPVLQARLPEQLQSSPLMDEARFVDDLEELYRALWRRWCEKA